MSKEIEQVLQLAEQDEPSLDDIDMGGPPEDIDSDELLELFGNVMSEAGVHTDEPQFLLRLAAVISGGNYDSYEYFFSDNPGAVNTVTEWITNEIDRNEEWKENLIAFLDEQNAFEGRDRE